MKEMSVMVTPANAKTALIIENTEPIGESGTWNIAFDKYLDTADAAIWPVKLVSFSLKPGEAGNSSGKIFGNVSDNGTEEGRCRHCSQYYRQY